MEGLNILECDNMVAWLHARDSLTNRLDDTGAFMSKDDWKRTLWILA